LVTIKKICCVGAGFVGGPTMAVFADKCPQLNIEIVDINKERINDWNQNDLTKLPIFEPGLKEIIQRVRGKNLHFSCDIESAIKNADMVFISVNTPIKQKGVGAGETSDLRWVESCARKISEVASGHTIVVEKSTLPVRTAQTIKDILNASNTKIDSFKNKKTFSVLSNPEFLAEGTAILNLERPDRVLIGGDDDHAVELLKKIYLNWVPPERIICSNLWSSELSKLTANAFLAQRISSINSITALCEVTGADIKEVRKAVGSDSRIGEKFISPGPGFGGSCFKKDILNLVYLCRYFGLNEVAEFWINTVKINSWQKERIYSLIVDKLYGNLFEKNIAILGFAFKSNTNDTRESPAIDICKNLIKEGAHLKIHDYKVSKQAISKELDLEPFTDDVTKQSTSKSWSFFNDVYQATKEVDAIIIITEWEDYKKIDWELIVRNLRKPSWIFDTRILLEPSYFENMDVNFWQLGLGY